MIQASDLKPMEIDYELGQKYLRYNTVGYSISLKKLISFQQRRKICFGHPSSLPALFLWGFATSDRNNWGLRKGAPENILKFCNRSDEDYSLRICEACRPFLPLVTSNSTRSPSIRER